MVPQFAKAPGSATMRRQPLSPTIVTSTECSPLPLLYQLGMQVKKVAADTEVLPQNLHGPFINQPNCQLALV